MYSLMRRSLPAVDTIDRHQLQSLLYIVLISYVLYLIDTQKAIPTTIPDIDFIYFLFYLPMYDAL